MEKLSEPEHLGEFNTMVSTNTRKAYQSDLAYIKHWGYVSFGNLSFPMTEHAVLLFITDHLKGMEGAKEKLLMSVLITKGYKAKPGLHSLATVRRRLFALTAYHKEQGYDNPCASNKITQLLRTITKTEAKAEPQKTITKDILEQLLTVCDGSVSGIRDKAILLLAWASGGRRRSEIIAAQVEHLKSMGEDFLWHIPAHDSKTGRAIDAPVKDKAAQALQDWMAVAGIKQGVIFRAVSKAGKVSDNPLSPIDVNRIVKRRCKAAGLDAKQFGAHSLRSGFLMERGKELLVEQWAKSCL